MVDLPPGRYIMGFSRTPLPPSLGQAAKFFPEGDADEQPCVIITLCIGTAFLF